MDIYRYKLQLAGAGWNIQVPMELPIDDTCSPFMTDRDGEDVQLVFRVGVPSGKETVISNGKSFSVWRGDDYYRIERNTSISLKRYTSVYLNDKNPLMIKGLIYPGGEENITSVKKILDISEMETVLASLDAVILHSSLVRYRKQAILFTAPSGTGKSTQASLWEEHRNGEVLNGDRSIIRKIHSQWTAFGSPFAGSSGIYRNESAPIRAIVILQQGETNRILRIEQAEAFRALYAQTVIPRWNDEVHKHIMDVLIKITEEVPIILLRCLPDVSAVDLLDHFLWEETE